MLVPLLEVLEDRLALSTLTLVGDYIGDLQYTTPGNDGDGAIRIHHDPGVYDPNTSAPAYQIQPYFASLGVIGLLETSRADRLAVAEGWMTWYLDHVESDGTIRDHWYYADGTVYTPQPTTLSDADDSNAAVFLLVCRAYLEAGGESTFFQASGVEAKIDLIAGVMTGLQQSDGLTWALDSYRVKFLADNAEVEAGFRAVSYLKANVYGNSSAAEMYDLAAEAVRTGIQTFLFDSGTGLFRIARFENNTTQNADLNVWYPGTALLLWPGIFGTIAPTSTQALVQMNALSESWDGSPNPSWSTTQTEWAAVGYGAALTRETEYIAQANTHLNTMLAEHFPTDTSLPQSGFTVADAGFLLRTLLTNDAPVLDTAPTPTVPVLNASAGDSLQGVTVASLLGSAVSDANVGDLQGIAVTGKTGSGTWEYSLDSGATWTGFGAVSDGQALLLRSTDRIRFLPASDHAGATLSYRAWDQSSGTAGATVSTVVNGGITAFSTAIETASVVEGSVILRGSTLIVGGTAANDTFAFTTGTSRQVTVNGVTFTLGSTQVSAVVFVGGAGSDAITLTGSDGADTATLAPNSGQMVGSDYAVSWTEMESTLLHSNGGADVATLADSGGNDSLAASPTQATLTGTGYTVQVNGVGTVTVSASGGNDTATLTDSAGNDSFAATATFAGLSGAGYSLYVLGFNSVQAMASSGNDTASLYDSAGNDSFAFAPTTATLSGLGFSNQANGFDNVYATASVGADTAALLDSASADSFVGTPTYATLTGPAYLAYAIGFDTVTATASTGMDTASLFDSVGNDSYVATPTYATLIHGTGSIHYAIGFDAVYSTASSGTDTASLYDSAGNDVFTGTPGYSYLSGTGLLAYAIGYDTVYSTATAGTDVAYLYDSAGDDTFTGTPTFAAMTGPGYALYAIGYDLVTAFASAGGNDTGHLHDSAGNDAFTGMGADAWLSGLGYSNFISGFDLVNLYGFLGGINTSFRGSVNYSLFQYGSWV